MDAIKQRDECARTADETMRRRAYGSAFCNEPTRRGAEGIGTLVIDKRTSRRDDRATQRDDPSTR